jgi:PAS domain S-box-containing protein
MRCTGTQEGMSNQSKISVDDALRESELSYRRLFEAAQDGILILDVGTGRITDVNPFLINLLGFPRDEMIDKTVGELSPFKDLVSNQAMLERLQEHGYVRYENLPLETIDGRHIAVEFVSNVYQTGDKNVIQCNIRDITERKKAELQVNQELERRVVERTASLRDAINQMEQFSYTVSHDLRAPLRAMQGYSNALIEDFSLEMGDEARSYLHRIADNATRLEKMISDILTFTRVSRESPLLTKISLIKLVRDVIDHYPGLKSPQAQIEVEVDVQHDVMAHESGLMQALSNLLGNAVKFVETGVVPKIRIRSEVRGPDVRLWVEDNGIGISPEYQHRLFGMFERVLPDEQYEGTGVGLAITRKVIERMGGEAGMESDGYSGSKFWIQLVRAGADQ